MTEGPGKARARAQDPDPTGRAVVVEWREWDREAEKARVLGEVMRRLAEAAERGEYYVNVDPGDVLLAYVHNDMSGEYAVVVLKSGVVLRVRGNYIRYDSVHECYCGE